MNRQIYDRQQPLSKMYLAGGLHYALPSPDPLEIIKLRMEERGLKAKDLEPVIGNKGHVSAILSGKRELTLKMARKLRVFFNLPAEVLLPLAG